jgi:hypothetical protein
MSDERGGSARVLAAIPSAGTSLACKTLFCSHLIALNVSRFYFYRDHGINSLDRIKEVLRPLALVRLVDWTSLWRIKRGPCSPSLPPEKSKHVAHQIHHNRKSVREKVDIVFEVDPA